jgi:hypothetical protein
MIRQIKYKNMKLNYNRLFTPVLYDVSLRDGIQTANKNNYPTSKKQDILHLCTFKTPILKDKNMVVILSKIFK